MKFLSFFLVIFCGFSGVSFAGDRTYVIGIEGAYFPDNFCGSLEQPRDCPAGLEGIIQKGGTTGGVNGFDVRIAEEICHRLEIKCRYKIVPWDQLSQNTVPRIFFRRDVDFLITAATRRRPRVKAFGPTAIKYSTNAPIRFVAKECWEDYQPQDLSGMTILTQSGTIYDEFLRKYYIPAGVVVRSLGTAQEVMDQMSDPEVDGLLAGLNGIPPAWIREQGHFVIKPKESVHPYFETGHRGSFPYISKRRISRRKRNKLLDQFNSVISELWANSLEAPESESIKKFEMEFKRGIYNPDWQILQEENCNEKRNEGKK